MLTLSLKEKVIELAAPEFYCPNCHLRRPYEIKRASEAHMIYAILFFEAQDLTQVVECQVCKNGFDPEILKPSHQSLFKLVAATRRQLLDGTSPGSLKVKLMSDGLKEDFINQLISLAQN